MKWVRFREFIKKYYKAINGLVITKDSIISNGNKIYDKTMFESDIKDVFPICEKTYFYIKTKHDYETEIIGYMHKSANYVKRLKLKGCVKDCSRAYIIYKIVNDKIRKPLVNRCFDANINNSIDLFTSLSFLLRIRKCYVVNKTICKNKNVFKEFCYIDSLKLSMFDNDAISFGSCYSDRRHFLYGNGTRTAIKPNSIDCSDKVVVVKYLDALRADEPSICFLYFYQILEYLSQKYAPAEFLQEIKNVISAKGKESKKYRKIKEIANNNNEQFVLRKLIFNNADFDDFKINFISKDNLYYLQKSPSFITQDDVKLVVDCDINFADTASKRIYKIRNAIVHSSIDGVKGNDYNQIYNWAENSVEISKELKLVRYIVDSIIMSLFK